MMKSLPLARQIGLGFLFMAGILAVVVTSTIIQINSLTATSNRLISVYEPTTRAGLRLDSGVNHAIAALRGWVLTTDDAFRQERQEAWTDEIRQPLGELASLSVNWQPENVTRLGRIGPLLDDLEELQETVEDLVSEDAERANDVLEEEMVPLAFEVREIIDVMVTNQLNTSSANAVDLSNEIAFLKNLVQVLLAAGMIAAVLCSVLITRSVTRPVSEAVSVADNIGAGDLETDVNVGGSRELDTLGRALINMRDSLRDKTRETAHFNWLSSGQNKLNEAMRGDQEVEQLAASIVTFMAGYVNAAIGALYLADEGQAQLTLCGGYAFGNGEVPGNFRLGQGVVGQAAAQMQPALLTNIDEAYIRVSSSLLDAPPHNIYVCPFAFEESTLGVMELGKLSAFTGSEVEFIQANMEAVAIALDSAVARRQIRQLLEETQQQSEELQQQQEELEQSNEELEEQTQQLREQQEELQAANEELEEQTQVIEEKNKNLEVARESIELKARQLEVSGKYKSEFLANMSHELRTPLNSLLILANDLADNGKGNLDDEQVESAQVISKSGHDLLNLINDILDLSKVEAGKLDIKIARIRLAEFAEELLRNFRRTAHESGLVMNLTIDPSLPETLRSDRTRVEQILNNLISNALKFTEQGGVTINFKLEQGDCLAIEVADTGIGIPQDKLDAVFQAFVQVEGGTSRKYGGTGLGLSISRELAGLLRGNIKVTSELGKGSVFTLVIPLSVDEESWENISGIKPAPAAERLDMDGKEHQYLDYPTIPDQRDDIREDDHVVLIVEDDESFARIVAAKASAKGFKHLNAATGEDGLRLASQYVPHAIILDLDLPGISGEHVLRELKNDPRVRHIPVHIVSVNEKSLDPIKSGAVDYFTKPVSKEQLDGAFSRIEDFINRKMKNLLVIEDDTAMRLAIIKLIGNGDVKCLEAGTAKEALEILKSNAIDCIVLDVGLPDMNGFELIKTLETEIPDSMPPVIVYTGRELSKQESDELEQYAETIIVKGVKSEERLLDETALFLHRTVKNLPAPKRKVIADLYDKEEMLRGKRILLVDDDMRNVFALSKVLRERGMDVIKAENGRIALEVLEQEAKIDFVLMDIMMPEMDGYECMRKIREQLQFRDLPIVSLTAKAMKDDRRKCIVAGANDYIAKPVDIDRLISLMRIWIRK